MLLTFSVSVATQWAGEKLIIKKKKWMYMQFMLVIILIDLLRLVKNSGMQHWDSYTLCLRYGIAKQDTINAYEIKNPQCENNLTSLCLIEGRK